MVFSGDSTHFEGEDVIITFEKEGADTVSNGEARITNLSITGGSSDVETVRTFGGSSITIQKPTGEYEVSFDYVTRDTFFAEINLSNTAAQHTQTAEHTSGNESNKKRWRVVLWFLGTGASTSTSGSIVVPKKVGEIFRIIFKDVYSSSNDVEFSSEEYMKGTITLKCGATDENAKGNVIKQYTKQYSTTALATLTTAHGGALTWNTTTPAWTGSYRT